MQNSQKEPTRGFDNPNGWNQERLDEIKNQWLELQTPALQDNNNSEERDETQQEQLINYAIGRVCQFDETAEEGLRYLYEDYQERKKDGRESDDQEELQHAIYELAAEELNNWIIRERRRFELKADQINQEKSKLTKHERSKARRQQETLEVGFTEQCEELIVQYFAYERSHETKEAKRRQQMKGTVRKICKRLLEEESTQKSKEAIKGANVEELYKEANADTKKIQDPTNEAYLPSPDEIRKGLDVQWPVAHSVQQLLGSIPYKVEDVAQFYLEWRDQQCESQASYTESDKKTLANLKQDEQRKDLHNDNKAFVEASKCFEGLFYPLFQTGFFGEDAALIIPSELDDRENGADVAVQIKIKAENGEIFYPIIVFDLTTADMNDLYGHTEEGKPKNKLTKVADRFNKKHSLTNLDHSTTCLGRGIPPIKDCPHFVICLSRKSRNDELELFKNDIVSANSSDRDIKKELHANVKFLINYQIADQAIKTAEYWEELKIKAANHWADKPKQYEQRIELFYAIHDYFEKRIYEDLAQQLGVNMDTADKDEKRALLEERTRRAQMIRNPNSGYLSSIGYLSLLD